jgi:hypothetical protein
LPDVIHSGYGTWERGRSRSASTNASKSSSVTEEMGHGSRWGRTLIFLAIRTTEEDGEKRKISFLAEGEDSV